MIRLNQEVRHRKKMRYTTVFVFALVLMFSMAYAEYRWKIFSSMPYEAGSTPVNASNVMQRNIHADRILAFRS